jgi:hypothetical protein
MKLAYHDFRGTIALTPLSMSIVLVARDAYERQAQILVRFVHSGG